MCSKATLAPVWSDVKANLAHLDRAGLIGLLNNLHGLNRDNQPSLHAPLGRAADPLVPDKKTISRSISPDLLRRQDTSVAKARKALSDSKKAIGLARQRDPPCRRFCRRLAIACRQRRATCRRTMKVRHSILNLPTPMQCREMQVTITPNHPSHGRPYAAADSSPKTTGQALAVTDHVRCLAYRVGLEPSMDHSIVTSTSKQRCAH